MLKLPLQSKEKEEKEEKELVEVEVMYRWIGQVHEEVGEGSEWTLQEVWKTYVTGMSYKIQSEEVSWHCAEFGDLRRKFEKESGLAFGVLVYLVYVFYF